MAAPILRTVRGLPDLTSRLLVSEDAEDRLGGAVPSPAAAFLLTLIALPSLFWLVTLKRTTTYTQPEEWLMTVVVPQVHAWVLAHAEPIDWLLKGISALGSGWFVALGFAFVGLLALAKGRRDLALLVALGTLAFPVEWALKFFTAIPEISFTQLVNAMFNVNNIGLDDIADFPAGHALRAMVFYGLVAFCVARLSSDRRQGIVAYGVAGGLIAAISVIRLYLGAHYPMDLLGGWMAGAALLSVLVSVHVLSVDERIRATERAQQRALAEALAAGAEVESDPDRRVAVPLVDGERTSSG
jgi:membrane-associated phospholipid phosphatase